VTAATAGIAEAHRVDDGASPPGQAGAAEEGWVGRVSVWVALAGGCLVLAIALLVTASVVRRWLTSDGIGGDFELVQTGLALGVFAFLPLCQLRGANIVVDTFTARLPARARGGLDAFWAATYALAAGILAWRLAAGAADTVTSGTTTMVLSLPIGWAIAASALLTAWLCLVALATAARFLRAGAARR
jgi:TRAP-type C4-dicarboxylate transport system permease small subunit